MVGRYFYHFSKMEQALDEGIGTLLRIERGAYAIVTTKVDFSVKIGILIAMEAHQAVLQTKHRKKLFNQLKEAAELRNVIAHSRFDPAESGGVVFYRKRVTTTLTSTEIRWNNEDIQRECKTLDLLAVTVKTLVETMTPYTPSLDFSDPRNSMYIPLL